ncbi:hypothetical protein J2T14_004565 [Paenibacillus harenae]|nr:hypothetical protein [Paenibacillus harenae]
MTPLEELLEQAKYNKKKGIAVISTEFVIKKLNDHRKHERVLRPPESLVETL